MRNSIASVFMLFFTAVMPAFADTPASVAVAPVQSGTIVVNITDLKKTLGMLGVSLHNSKSGFPGKHEQAYANQTKKITGPVEKVIFENVPFGTYAISVVHDENSNGKLDKNFIGIPKEGVGVSNNPKIGMGGPKFDPCTFMLNNGQIELTIAMKYL
ncbi:MAG: DUF2141 domain-containing protein [Chlorobiaceae bacterium]|nr:DUF2141 domain-containing protein [Chlorobiaceae bacterium]